MTRVSHQREISLDESGASGTRSANSPQSGLIVNADDWGRNVETTDRTLDCIRCCSVSSVSAMVFMEDSERAAKIARETRIDAGLHLNFTSSFTAAGIPPSLVEHQARVAQYLLRNRLNQIVFHPGLTRSFEYMVAAQREEFTRLYGLPPSRFDGHHHMHLCANVLLGGLLPSGTIVRRNFSFQRGEKSLTNRCYRQIIDYVLARHHHLVDFFFSIQPLTPLNRLEQIAELSRRCMVELETHPQQLDEYSFLTGGGIRRLVGDQAIKRKYDVCCISA